MGLLFEEGRGIARKLRIAAGELRCYRRGESLGTCKRLSGLRIQLMIVVAEYPAQKTLGHICFPISGKTDSKVKLTPEVLQGPLKK
jgi:hypothetical protein